MKPSQTTWRNELSALAIALYMLCLAGCACWQCPRIDPTGESLFLWPGQTTPALVAAPPTAIGPAPFVAGPPVAAPPVAVPAVVAPSPVFGGNVEAPPVYPDVPAAPLPATIPAMPAPALPVTTVPLSAAMPIGQDHLRITPERLMAPVGTEVVLKAGICGADGYFRTDQRIEWLLAREGAGQFVDLGDRDQHDIFRYWGDTPRKIDNWYAIGATSYASTVLQRGNLDPRDDVVVQKGEAWISVASATEGTSHITAYSPYVPAWQFRRAVATIYWIDAQWIFPPSAVVEPGRPHVLTTTVTRRTDGTPLAGWIVRYEVPGGGASLGYQGGNFVEVPTDEAGRASVEVSPTGSGSGVNNVTMTLFRPATAGPGASPQLEIGRGAATITWGGVVSEPIPSVAPAPGPASPAPITSQPPIEPTPSAPTETPSARPPASGSPVTPPREEAPAGQAQLDVRVTREGPEEVEVNQFVRFNVTVTNRGDGVARGVEISDRFNPGLGHPRAEPNTFELKSTEKFDLAPGQSREMPLTFQVLAVGQQSHSVTATAEGGVHGFDRGTVIGIAATPAPQAVITADKIGPTQAYIGETAKFSIILKNTGTVPVTNLKVVDKFDPAFEPIDTVRDIEHERGPDGSIIWNVPRLEVGQRLAINVTCNCVAQSGSACNNLIVTGDGGINLVDQVCVEILPPPTGAGSGTPPGTSAGPLRATVVVNRNPVSVGQSATILITVENATQQAQQQVQLRVVFPPDEMAIDSSQIEPRGEFAVIAQEVKFEHMDYLPGQQREFRIPVNNLRPGQVRVRARLEGAGLPQAIESRSNVIQILPAPL